MRGIIEIEQDQPRTAAAVQVVQRLLAVDGAFDDIAFVAQRFRQGLPYVEVIFDERES